MNDRRFVEARLGFWIAVLLALFGLGLGLGLGLGGGGYGMNWRGGNEEN